MELDIFDKVRRRIKRYWKRFAIGYLKASGLGPWRPLVPAKEFTATVAQSLDRLLLREESRDLGAYVEFGVSRGTSLACVYRELRARKLDHVRLVGFDSFEGMPAGSAAEGWKPGAYRSTLAATKRYLSSQGVTFENVELVKGWFEDTLTPATKQRLGLTKVSLIMLDCDTYAATKLALEYILPLIREQAVVIFDDWGGRADRNMLGQREAFQEVIADRRVFSAEPCPAYSSGARVFLLTRLPASPA
jgi:O-methyltransferase